MESCAARNIRKYCLLNDGSAEVPEDSLPGKELVFEIKTEKEKQNKGGHRVGEVKTQTILLKTHCCHVLLQTLALSYMSGTISRFDFHSISGNAPQQNKS